jgi:hypothetical protein
MAGVLGGPLDRGAAAEHDQVGERDLLAAGVGAVERLPDALSRLVVPPVSPLTYALRTTFPV